MQHTHRGGWRGEILSANWFGVGLLAAVPECCRIVMSIGRDHVPGAEARFSRVLNVWAEAQTYLRSKSDGPRKHKRRGWQCSLGSTSDGESHDPSEAQATGMAMLPRKHKRRRWQCSLGSTSDGASHDPSEAKATREPSFANAQVSPRQKFASEQQRIAMALETSSGRWALWTRSCIRTRLPSIEIRPLER